ncbi:Ig-like domain-containing protein [Vibrio kanaloae]|uniref:Ig-like domain-containing protein n=2 Tax=Vibrio kanaloae TaxID=170673 RepID=UPI001EFE8A30|nr:Ig-like domain-containing protein [Vibrio kanaloae]MCG9558318.1 Ig-like domain-containing protein [Vibrio kanaloae]
MDVTVLNLVSLLALGQRIVISLDGTIRVLQDGESLQPGDVILESPNESQISIKRFSPEDGSEVELEQDIANIFAALEEGQDPTELGEEFATEAGQNGSSISISATIERNGQETTPGTEFVTTGFEALGMSRTQSLSLLDAFRSIDQRLGTDNETIGDTTAPDAPTLTLDTDSGSAADDLLTNDGSFTVGGTEEGATAEYLVDGNWTTTAPVPTEGDNTITVRQTDAAGNTSGSSELTFTLDTTAPAAPTLTLDTDSGSAADDFLTNDGSFTVGGTEEGATVEYLVDGNWTTTAPVPTEGDNTITVRQTDAAGNASGSSELTFTLDTTAPDAPTLTLDTDSGSAADDFLTNDGSFTVGGTEEGATVEFLVDGNWTTTAPIPTEGDNTITVRQTDAAGNTSGSSELMFTLDTQAAQGIVTVDNITADDVITVTEQSQTIAVTGRATGGDIEPGDSVTATINGNEYTTTVNEDGGWQLDVSGEDLALDTDFNVTVESTDIAGNSSNSTGISEHSYNDTPLIVNLNVDPVTDDSIINSSESQAAITITGSVTGDEFSSGTVSLVINGNQYTGVVNPDTGLFEIEVNGSDLVADSDTIIDASVSVVNDIGQVGDAESTEKYFTDTSAAAVIRVDRITADDIINSEESQGNVFVSGRVGFDAGPGDTVTLDINGNTYTTTVLGDKTWFVEVSGQDLANDTQFYASVSGIDDAGNPYTATTVSTHTVDLEADKGTVTVDDITADDVINKAESGQTITVSGTAKGGDISEGDVVTMTINGTEYTTTLDGDGNWAVDVAGSDLAQDAEFEVLVTSTDSVGNSVQSKVISNHSVDTQIGTDNDAETSAVSIDSITEDTADATDFITSDNQLVISGSVELADGDSLTVNFNGTDYTTDNGLVIADGKWTLDVTGTTLE